MAKISKQYVEAIPKSLSTGFPSQYFEDLISFIKEFKPAKKEIANEKIRLSKKYESNGLPTDIEVLLSAEKKDVAFLRKYLKTKPVRTGSGVAVIAIMSAPFRCPHGKCTYCPGGPNSYFGDVPQSYTGHEPATMRGIRNDYDAYLQVMNRLEQYIAIGQNPDKVELIIMGGTFPSYAYEYQEEFVRGAFQAMNDFSREFYKEGELDIEKFREFFMLPGSISDANRTRLIKEKLLLLKKSGVSSIMDEQKKNEDSAIRCVGLTIETKPDWGFREHGEKMLKLGCTRVELGIQTLFDNVLRETHRGHDLKDSIRSINELKDLGFKLNFHMMPGLPGVSRDQDVWCFKELFNNQDYRPDMLKIYPTMVMPGTKLYVDYKKSKYTPLTTMESADIISESFRFIPRYCRIMRVQRDIPTKYSEGGVDKNNLRQLVEEAVERKGYKSVDISTREIRSRNISGEVNFEIIDYDSSNGKDFFISLKDEKDALLGFARLRFPSKALRKEFTNGTCIVRELHVYGEAARIASSDSNAQHRGFGRSLMAKAEEIALMHRKDKILVISGIGVRNYYRKLGYELEGPYMAKFLPRPK